MIPGVLCGADRIMVVGCGGSGKSTFSRRLAAALDIPVVHLDAHFWKPGWVEPEREEWERRVRELAAREFWIMDGNYGGTMDIRLERAQVVVFMDFSRAACLRGVLGRRIAYRNRSRPDMAPGCPEKLDWSFVKYVWNYRRTRRPGILEKLRDLPEGREGIILENRRESKELLAAVGG